ncbi:TonB-dependent receptor [Pseudoalteromonas sp. SSMSWG5]|uniref:TonB-dependent receptor n=1 Tax=Pseudoalteromonas sp. SSMSWG5 TaxID=3139396 RepID=UPI003BABEF8F
MKNNFSKTFKRSFTAAAVAMTLSAAMPAMADNVNGAIKGNIITQSGVSLAGATITITDKSKGYEKTLIADANGQFNLNQVPVGKYNVTVSQAGFEKAQINDVIIGVGKTALLEIPLVEGNIERIAVVGGAVRAVDVSVTESSLNISSEELELLPVARSLTSVALLAPGATEGDSRFGDQASFGGSSVAENAYYVNGLNMTNFRNGLGGATIPFSAYDSFQIKTGGYSSEFGRTTGGLISAVTKSGTNDFHFGVESIYSPDSLREQAPNSVYLQNDRCEAADGHCIGDLFVNNQDDYVNSFETNIYASGALIEDTLFFYGIYTFRDIEEEYGNASQTSLTKEKDDDPYYLARIDWNINDDHQLMLWGFSDERTYSESTIEDPNGVGNYTVDGGTAYHKRGGESFAVRYTGNLTDDLSMSAMYGEVKFSETDYSDFDDCPTGYDADLGVDTTCYVNFTVGANEDKREQLRVDFDWYLNDEHTLRFGYDSETNTSDATTINSGGIYYYYRTYEEGARLPNGYILPEEMKTTRVRNYKNGGAFEVENWAIYIEDQWAVTDNLTLTLGLRNDSFTNYNADGDEFVSIDNQIAPRLGASWDINGDGDSKLFITAGRYYLPVAANTNIRLAGAETYIHTWYEYEGLNADGTPVGLSNQLGDIAISNGGDGTAKPSNTLADKDLEPMYNDEIIVGYQAAINDDWSWSIKGTYRTLGNQIDDGSYIFRDEDGEKIGENWFLFNPGNGATFNFDLDGDGVTEEYSFTAEELGYPEAKRRYAAVDLSIEKSWDEVWSLKALYTWSHNYGNTEGFVKSDNGQDDAGLTQDWDYPYLMDGANGNLPADRRHNIKVYGAYAVTENFLVGANLNVASGRPWTALGAGYTPNPDLYDYGDTYYVGDKRYPRGSMGTTPWTARLDLNFTYNLHFNDQKVRFALDIFNVFDAATATRYDEVAEIAAGDDSATFGLAESYQSPRRVQLSASYDF